MVKVLLAYDEFKELSLTVSYLKKIGFDVVGITNELLIQDQILAFHPDVIVAHGKSSKVSSFSVSQKLKDNAKYTGKIVIVVPHGVRPSPNEIIRMKMDAVIEAPVNPEKLIQVLAKLGRLDVVPLLEKLQRARMSDPELEKMMWTHRPTEESAENLAEAVAGLAKKTSIPIQDAARAEKYSKMVKDIKMNPEETTFDRKSVRDRQNQLKKDWDFDEMEELDKLRRQFAGALFKKNK